MRNSLYSFYIFLLFVNKILTIRMLSRICFKINEKQYNTFNELINNIKANKTLM